MPLPLTLYTCVVPLFTKRLPLRSTARYCGRSNPVAMEAWLNAVPASVSLYRTPRAASAMYTFPLASTAGTVAPEKPVNVFASA